ncbi:Predicted transport protein [Ruminococcaceae bacterium YRB3002]|nr:Predicted transport protein [Ruminococcaceae bacterium YRB3002]
MEKSGYIYVLTNESFHRENWIKIGYAEDVDKRIKELSGTAVPLPYKLYCTYEIPRIKGVKDPDKLLHDLISKINPDLRITPNREFFEMYPWDAYDMLFAIAQMHGRLDKLVRNNENNAGQDIAEDGDYTVEALFPINSELRALYERLNSIIISIDDGLEQVPRKLYVAYKYDRKHRALSLWPKSDCIEVILCGKSGQIDDKYGMVYDISNRKWGSSRYAFRFGRDTDIDAATELVRRAIPTKT